MKYGFCYYWAYTVGCVLEYCPCSQALCCVDRLQCACKQSSSLINGSGWSASQHAEFISRETAIGTHLKGAEWTSLAVKKVFLSLVTLIQPVASHFSGILRLWVMFDLFYGHLCVLYRNKFHSCCNYARFYFLRSLSNSCVRVGSHYTVSDFNARNAMSFRKRSRKCECKRILSPLPRYFKCSLEAGPFIESSNGYSGSMFSQCE